MAPLYRRRVSATEAREAQVMITKDRVGRFPPPGQEFVLHRHGRVERVAVVAVDCTCRGPELPHQHWFLPWPGVTAGSVIEITGDGTELTATVVDA